MNQNDPVARLRWSLSCCEKTLGTHTQQERKGDKGPTAGRTTANAEKRVSRPMLARIDSLDSLDW